MRMQSSHSSRCDSAQTMNFCMVPILSGLRGNDARRASTDATVRVSPNWSNRPTAPRPVLYGDFVGGALCPDARDAIPRTGASMSPGGDGLIAQGTGLTSPAITDLALRAARRGIKPLP